MNGHCAIKFQNAICCSLISKWWMKVNQLPVVYFSDTFKVLIYQDLSQPISSQILLQPQQKKWPADEFPCESAPFGQVKWVNLVKKI